MELQSRDCYAPQGLLHGLCMALRLQGTRLAARPRGPSSPGATSKTIQHVCGVAMKGRPLAPPPLEWAVWRMLCAAHTFGLHCVPHTPLAYIVCRTHLWPTLCATHTFGLHCVPHTPLAYIVCHTHTCTSTCSAKVRDLRLLRRWYSLAVVPLGVRARGGAR